MVQSIARSIGIYNLFEIMYTKKNYMTLQLFQI